MEIVHENGTHTELMVVQMLGDGNCCFRALSYLLFADIQRHVEVRRMVVEHVVTRWDEYANRTIDGNGNNYHNPDVYKDVMCRDGTFGSACEVQAATEVFPGHCFKIYCDGFHVISFGAGSVRRMRFSGNPSCGHFDAYEEPAENANIFTFATVAGTPAITGNKAGRPTKNKRGRKKISDISKTNENVETRKEKDRERKSLNRATQSTCSKVKILEQTKNSMMKLREKETKEERKERLNDMRKRHRKRIEEETKEKREERLDDMRKRRRKRTEEETKEESEERMDDMRKRRRKRIEEETKEERENRLDDMRKRRRKSVANKSEEERLKRLTDFENRVASSRASVWKIKKNSGFHYDANIAYDIDSEVAIGCMDIVCMHCNALKWKGESAGLCCLNGKVMLEDIGEPPEPLRSLLNGNHPHSSHFLNLSRKYNSAFQMTSFGCKRIEVGNFMPTFKIQGQVYHLVGSLMPFADQEPTFLQLYFIGDDETDIRSKMNPGLNIDLLKSLQTMLHNNNNYINSFKTSLENNKSTDNFKVIIYADKKPPAVHRGRFNAPTVNEVAVLIAGQHFEKRDIILKNKDNMLQRISETHRSYDALQYPLMFPRGEDGYNFLLKHTDGQKNLSAMNFYSFRLMKRKDNNNSLLYYRQLLNQFLVDMYAKIESERLNFIRHNQSKMRVDDYIHLRDAIDNDGHANNIGQLFILPSSFTGSSRYMHERTQDAMTYVRKYGKPQLFITFTCNPKWEEITMELLKNQKSHERHDIMCRVFQLKVKTMMKLLTRGEIFGSVRCHMYSIEWQKRGLPHVHILLWLEKQVEPNKLDTFISAELPDPTLDPALFEIVSTNMIHGPCGAFNLNSPCMKDGKCTKGYPRRFVKETQTGNDGYPTYRRRSSDDGGMSFKKRYKKNLFTIDNRWVVPYSPVLSRTFKAHINVEFCNSVKSIKYICKYVNKGSDQATFTIGTEKDEILQYQTGRYISTSEAVWRILSFPIHERYPTVVHLSVHLENGQRVYFNPNNVQMDSPPITTLTAFFDLCKYDEFARTLLYNEVPSYYSWNNKQFRKRKQGSVVDGCPQVRRSTAIGRVYTVHPNNAECYFLRMLLHHVRGPKSFQDLRTINGHVHPDFRLACKALGLLEDNAHWKNTLSEAALSESPKKLRELFVIMLVFCEISDHHELWIEFRDELSEDILRQAQLPGITVTYNYTIYNQCLILLEDKVEGISGKRLDSYGLPLPNRTDTGLKGSLYAMEMNYNPAHLIDFLSENEGLLVGQQRNVYDTVLDSVIKDLGKFFFIDAPGGTGKTFLTNILLAKVRHSGKIALAVASSGIAATLLEGGRTAHSTFKLPINLIYTDDPVCNIKKGTTNAKLLKECALIVWDECTMSPKAGFEALDRTLRDIRGDDRVMGGVTVVLSGDFRQTLPVVPRGTRADEVKACLKYSVLWSKIETLKLTVNMRVQLKGHNIGKVFSDLLMKIGNGNLNNYPNGEMDIPANLGNLVSNLDELIIKIYPEVQKLQEKSSEWFCERCILAARNETADFINNKIMGQFNAEEKTYMSIDRMVEESESINYPIEFLNSLQPTGLPPNKLCLKIGAPIMCLRNLNPPILCNGTRLQVIGMMDNVIEATILTGRGKGERVFIPRIPLIPSDYPFQFKRLQFPVKICFAMTINKSQGQSIQYTGVDLRTPCFSHGQFYVACSRVSSPDNLYLLAPTGRTSNIVYNEILK